MRELPLDGVRVLDLTRVLAGPHASQILGDLGASIWKVERPDGGDDTRQWGPVELQGETAYFLSINRNKRSLILDLKSESGRELALRLAEHADVVLENFPKGKLDALGLGWDVLRSRNPRLVLTSITAFGEVGPLSDEPGYDLVVQGWGGVMAVTGPEDGTPYRVGVPIVDLTTGMNAALATLAALRARDRDGLGQHVSISMFDTHLAWLANVGANALISGQPSKRLGNAHPNVAPYEPMPALDGYLLLAVGNDGQWRRLLGVEGFAHLDRAEWASNDGRLSDRKALVDALSAVFRTRSRAEWREKLLAARVPSGPVLRPDEALAHPQARETGMIVPIDHGKAGRYEAIGSPYRFSETPISRYTPPPLLGEHTAEVLLEVLGLDGAEIEQLAAAGAFGVTPTGKGA